MNYLNNAGVFLIQTLFGLFELVVLMRLLMQYVRADFHNPLAQFVVKASNPLLRPLRRIIPGMVGIDMASVVLLLLVVMLELLLISLVSPLPMPTIPGLIALAVVEVLKLTVYVFMFAIFLLAILSWISPGGYNPVATLMMQISAPLMRPARRLIPPIGGLDLSPMAVLIVLWLIILLVITPLTDLARQLAYARPLLLP